MAITDAGGPRSISAQDLAGTGHSYDSDVTFKFTWKNEGGQGQDDPSAPPDQPAQPNPPAPTSIQGAKLALPIKTVTVKIKVK